jgi:hypothetical protein
VTERENWNVESGCRGGAFARESKDPRRPCRRAWRPAPSRFLSDDVDSLDLSACEPNLPLMTIVLTRVKSLFVFVFHQVVGTWGIAFIAAFGLFSLFDMVPDSVGWKPSVQFAHRLLTENPYYPIRIVSGLYFGWLLGRRFQHRSMLWIWVLPLLILGLCFCCHAYPRSLGIGTRPARGCLARTRIGGHDRLPKRRHSIRAVLAAGALGTSWESAAVLMVAALVM